MRLIRCQWLVLFFSSTILIVFATATEKSVQGLIKLLGRRLPAHVDDFEFQIQGNHTLGETNDEYVVSQTVAGKILIEGNSLSGIASGYVTQIDFVCHFLTYKIGYANILQISCTWISGGILVLNFILLPKVYQL